MRVIRASCVSYFEWTEEISESSNLLILRYMIGGYRCVNYELSVHCRNWKKYE